MLHQLLQTLVFLELHLIVHQNLQCWILGGLKHELNGTGVGITVVSPIMVRTDFFDHPSFEKMPKYSPTSLSSKTVAKAILKAANSPRLEIIVPSVVRSAVWLKHTFPYFINPIMGKSFKKQLDAVK